MTRQSKEDIALVSLAALSLAGIVLIWWLS